MEKIREAEKIATSNKEKIRFESEKKANLIANINKALKEANNSIEFCDKQVDQGVSIQEELFNSSSSLTNLREELIELSNLFKSLIKEIHSITKISQNSRILSFNTNIEAAHAGEFGKGFQVIADEITMFSEKTMTITGDIKKRLEQNEKKLKDFSNLLFNFTKKNQSLFAEEYESFNLIKDEVKTLKNHCLPIIREC